ncbi:hypothetical protein R6Q59_005142 [Mikania micrantha]
MEVDGVQTQVRKFQKISCNGSYVTDTSSNPNKLATQRGNFGLQHQNHLFPVEDAAAGGVGRLCGWPSSRIVRVSRASGGKDRHSKVVTSKGLRDRRIRLSVTTAIDFYDLQDRLGYDQPSKAVDWLIKAASGSIAELPDLHPSSFAGTNKSIGGNDADFEDPNHQTNHCHHQQQQHNNSNSNSDVLLSRSSVCSSTSETSKGSGLSISRSKNRIRARERARDMAAKKEKEKESSSFTDLLTGGITGNSTPMDYSQMPQFNIFAGDNQPHQNHQFSFFQDNFAPVVTVAGVGGLTPPLNRGTLQSNLLSSLHHHHHLQRFQSPVSMVDGSTPANLSFFIAPTISSGGPEHFPATGYDSQLLQLYGDHYKGKSNN